MNRATAFAVVALAALGCATTAGSGGAVRAGQPLPALTVKALDGSALDLGALKGQVVLLDVWASWCEPCKEELPMLDAIASRHKDQGIVVLAVSIDEERSNVDAFLAKKPSWTLRVAHDPAGGPISTTLDPQKMPTSYVIDRAGVVRHVNEGFTPADAARIEAQLVELAR